jgi:hypothetical protein
VILATFTVVPAFAGATVMRYHSRLGPARH